MYLHLGSDIIVSEQHIIGVFDLENTSVSKFTRDFLRKKQEEGRVVNIALDLPKSFMVCAAGRKETVYLSQLAASTLRRRSLKKAALF